MDLVILCDFDGTVASIDVGSVFFRTHTNEEWWTIIERWKSGEISSKECLIWECENVNATVSDLKHFALQQQIDSNFKEFVRFARSKKIEIAILSDGLDFYIDLILKKYQLDFLPYFANHLIRRKNKLIPTFPYYDKGCGRCGNCKRYHCLSYKQQGKHVFYVGDGYSDRCVANEVDLLFAKKDLLRYCQENQLQYIEFNDFSEIIAQLKNMKLYKHHTDTEV